MRFHAHVYYIEETRASAYVLRERMLELAGIEAGPLEDTLRGPHQRSMFELRFGTAQFAQVVLWLLFHRGDHPVLIHALTGHDPRDHDRHAFWLGEALPLDFERLDPPPADAMMDILPSFEPG